MKKLRLSIAGTCVGVAVVLLSRPPAPQDDSYGPHGPPVLGNAELFRARYESWKQEAAAEQPVLVIPLSSKLGHAPAASPAVGEVKVDLASGAVTAEVRGLPDVDHEIWLVDATAVPEQRVDLGMLVASPDGTRRLDVQLAEADLRGLCVDQVLVAPTGADPRSASTLAGAVALFQRLYVAELAAERAAAREDSVARASIGLPWLALFLGAPEDFPPPDPTADTLSNLISKGEFLFFNETFNGNGRTCGTCHPAENNLTLDAKFISQMPNKDRLFLAEFDANLNSDVNGGLRFEIPELMRRFAVILENLDGFGDLKKRFTMRGIPHTFSQGSSIKNPPGGISPPTQRTGWSGDGSPFGPVGLLLTTGSLRDFSVGAVRQHFTKTLGRVIGTDFRLPTPAELDAMEAFMLSLGRQADTDLNSFTLLDPDAEAGRVRFLGSFCNACHENAGANISDFNFNFDTGVEEFLQNRIGDFDGTGQPRPADGGFGTAPNGSFPAIPVPNPDGSFGDRTFNVPSLVEAADTPPFFHNNIFEDIEGAVSFYRSVEFESRFGPIIGAADIPILGKFLRVINAIDNIENSGARQIERAIHFLSLPIPFVNLHDVVNRLLRIAVADICDSVEVLADVDLHPSEREKLLKPAIGLIEQAMAPLKPSVRIDLLKQALELLKEAIANMRT